MSFEYTSQICCLLLLRGVPSKCNLPQRNEFFLVGFLHDLGRRLPRHATSFNCSQEFLFHATFPQHLLKIGFPTKQFSRNVAETGAIIFYRNNEKNKREFSCRNGGVLFFRCFFKSDFVAELTQRFFWEKTWDVL